MNSTSPDTTISYRDELIRKAIHFCSLSIPIFYFYTPRALALAILIPLTLALVIVDVARHNHPSVESWFYKTFGYLLRQHETNREAKRLNGATYVLIAATICVLVFPKLIAVTSFIILIISDMMGALIGRRFGKHRFFGKSLEGSAAFFVSALLIIFFTPKINYEFNEYLLGTIAAATGTIFEALPWEIDDNLSIPLSVGAILWSGYALFLPALNIYKFG